MKYQYLYDAIIEKTQHDSDWRDKVALFSPEALTFADIKQVHGDEYVEQLATGTLPANKMRRIGFPWSALLVQRTLTSAAGTVLTAKLAIEHGVAIHLSGGYHHAHKDFGSGFCLFNDLVLAAHFALQSEDIDKVLIIDSDVHHGDGTATLCQDRDDIITVSFHCDKNFPARKPDSDFDVPLTRDTDDDTFLTTFKQVVEMAVNLHQPDLVIYDAGVDLHQDDELGYLNISTLAIYQRDHFLFSTMKSRGIPVAAVVGGGYRTEQRALVPVHFQLIQAAFDIYN
jgi:acetoin utilization deacetylase AcuC-like enzyme